MFNKNKPYIIAEIGLNHSGNINLAKILIKNAKEAGANAAKFQIFEPQTLGRDIKKKDVANYKWKKLYTSDKKIRLLINYCKKIGIDFLCSVFDQESLERVKKYKLKYIKIASSEVNNLELLKKIKRLNIKPILSTGMSDDKEISKAIKILGKPILLHCVSLYPCDPSKINLNRMITLKKKYKLKTGFSDHTTGIDACKIAIIKGAEFIEKHFTYNKKLKGFDHILSAEKEELADLVNFSKNFKLYFGNGKISPTKEELKIQRLARKGIYFSKSLKKGHLLSVNDLTFLRPENGLDINNFKFFLRKKLNRDVSKFQSLNKKYFY